MIREESKKECLGTESCGSADYYLCKRKDECLEAAENLESMTAANGKAGVPFRVYGAYRKERWGLSGMALNEMLTALSHVWIWRGM